MTNETLKKARELDDLLKWYENLYQTALCCKTIQFNGNKLYASLGSLDTQNGNYAFVNIRDYTIALCKEKINILKNEIAQL